MDLLFMDIINSNRVDWRNSKIQRDMLDDEQWVRGFVEKWGLAATLPINAYYLKELKKLREQMRNFCHALNSEFVLQQEQHNEFNFILSGVSSQVQLKYDNNTFDIEHIYNAEDWALIIWHIAYSFARLLCKPEIDRLKVCSNQNCEWIFLDLSRNKSRLWCDTKVCGNIMKVRRFRNRKKNQND